MKRQLLKIISWRGVGLRELREKCGVFGAITQSGDAARLTYYALWALQHRGQESSGIVSSDGRNFFRHVGTGLVAQIYHEEDLKTLIGGLAIGHNRYSTSGSAHGAHMQPVLESAEIAVAHNGNLPSVTQLVEFLSERGVETEGRNDSELMAAALAWYVGEGKSLPEAVKAAYPLLTGAFSCVAMDQKQLVGWRDECGIRPLSLGRLADGFALSSETCAFDTVGAAFLRDVKPGEMIVVDEAGVRSEQLVAPRPAFDVFEYIYFARPDSILMGRRVNEVRRRLGEALAKEHPLKADVVIPVPDSAIPAAIGYAAASGIPFDHGLIKNRYIHRTFIRPTQSMRERDVKTKLNPVPEVLMGKDVVVVDDSIVRGTTTKQIVNLLYGAGARKVHVLISSPPVKYPDFYGIDTPHQKDLIAARMTEPEIAEWMGAASLGYLSVEATVAATKWPQEELCLACFDGKYPIDLRERAKEVMQLV